MYTGGATEDAEMHGDALRAEVAARLARLAAGSSTRVARALVVARPPSVSAGEVTAKGNLNAERVRTRRARLVERLYDDRDAATVITARR